MRQRTKDAARGAAQQLERADLALGLKLARHRKRPAVQAAAKAGKLGDQEPLYVLSALVLVAGLVGARPKLAATGLSLGVAVGVADLLKSGVKRLATRTRPHVLMDEGRYERRLGASDRKPEQSFPSGHMAGTTAAAVALAMRYPRSWPFGAAVCAALGWSRVSKAAHWPLDVAAGAVIGIVGGLGGDLAVRAAVAYSAARLRAAGWVTLRQREVMARWSAPLTTLRTHALSPLTAITSK